MAVIKGHEIDVGNGVFYVTKMKKNLRYTRPNDHYLLKQST
ncbi:MAG: hypothetical protein WCQ70_02075 [Lentimicrobiaceae bacterium]